MTSQLVKHFVEEMVKVAGDVDPLGQVHELKLATTIRRWNVTARKCGWRSPLCATPEQANRLLAEHMRAVA